VSKRVCKRCGIDRDLPTKRAKNTNLCRGCRSKVEHVVRYDQKNYCLAWRGDFDEYDNPMHNGKLYLAGERTCGHKDCINEEHINRKDT